MDTNRTFCPICGHKFKQGEYNFNYDTALIDYTCHNCDWEGNSVINAEKVENDLYDKLSDYDLDEIEITDEDVNLVMNQLEEGEEYEDALNFVLNGIRDCLD